MPLYLVQHGQALPKDQDPEKGLSPAGRDSVRRIAEVAQGYKVSVASIKHSGKKRARQTAEILAAVLQPPGGLQVQDGLHPRDDVKLLPTELASQANLMLVGHLPFLEKLTAYLITGSTEPRVIRFQNGGIVCLVEDPSPGDWVIRWALMPQID
jgi:phosphohistidine phosphatase